MNDHLNLSQAKQNVKLKLKLVGPVCTESMKLK